MATASVKGKAKRIIFFGDDDNMFDDLKPRFTDKYAQFEWEFITFKEDPSEHIQKKYLSLLTLKSVIIYFDFSTYSDNLRILVEMVMGDSNFKHCAKVGFVTNKENTMKYTGLGLDFIHVKGAEIHDFVFGPITQALPDVAIKEKFATAKCEESVTLYSFAKVGFMTASYMHVESDTELEEGTEVYVHHNVDKGTLPSSNFTIKKSYDHDLHYSFDYAYDLEYHYVDQPTLDDDELMHQDDDLDPAEQAEKLERERERRQEEIETFDHRLKQTKKKVKDYVWDRLDETKEKKLKVLIFDPQMRILKEEGCKPLDAFPFSVRCFSKFSDDLDEIDKLRPGIIAIQLIGRVEVEDQEMFMKAIEAYKEKDNPDGPPKSEFIMTDDEKEINRLKKNLAEFEAEDNEMVKVLITKVKSIANYNPIIVLMNCHFQSATVLQQTYQYAMIMTNESSISTAIIEPMAVMFMKKQKEKYETLMTQKLNQLKQKDPKKYQKFSVSDLKEKRLYIDKYDQLSVARFTNAGIIVRLNESEVMITCESILRMGIYYIEEPFSMFITLVPVEKGKPYVKERGTNFYRGLINGITEDEKKELRVYVNEVFFKPLEEKKAKELEDFQKLNELKLEEKVEEEKRLEEERLATLNEVDGESEETP